MNGVLNHALAHVVRVARGCYRALVAFGSCWLPLPEDQLRRILYGEVGQGGKDEERGPETGTTTTAPTPASASAPVAAAAATPGTTPVTARATATAWTPGPPPGHPERLRFDVPLSELEARLARELRGV
ncbi:hypothetical protein OG357_28145 [Streptomyces sp. NBC_01255]|uniref:DUF6059 family protein n=1 Tax=Streptomyces sp. NBC_01255 TaxID=2903798 RepID=UPI002E30DFCA|nr:DUF6059 family protein [Streptomyces sp. NBC_01255]